MKKIIVAIDGYSGCGKSSTAKAVAKALNYTYIDSGAMYRAATFHFLNRYTNLTNPIAIQESLDALEIQFNKNVNGSEQYVFMNGVNVDDSIRSMPVTEMVSEVSKIKEVRRAMVFQQRILGKKKEIVMDGRDIGTVVFPDAELKVFMTADLDIRAARRQKEYLEKGTLADLETIKKNLAERDRIDTTRTESPLTKAADAVEIDTSFLDFEDQVQKIVDLAKNIIG